MKAKQMNQATKTATTAEPAPWPGLIIILVIIGLVVGGIILLGGTDGSSSIGKEASIAEADLPQVVDGVQTARITVNNTSYSPRITPLRKGVPVELTFFGQGSGCSTAIISRDFWKGTIFVNRGQQKTVKFTPTEAGTYKYTCTMGMYTGWFEVV